MSRLLLFVLLFLLAGCCSLASDAHHRTCEASRQAAGHGWKHVRHGFSPKVQPTLHKGMTKRELKKEWGAPLRKKEHRASEQWIYPEHALVVVIKDGHVVRWKRQQKG